MRGRSLLSLPIHELSRLEVDGNGSESQGPARGGDGFCGSNAQKVGRPKKYFMT